MAKRILVTGGAGFIGSHLCEKLVAQGDTVYCLDNFFTGRKANVEKLLHCENFHLIEHDVVDPIDIEVDQIYNLACPASPVKYRFDSVKTLKTSIFGALNILELAKKYHARVLQASTSEVYGEPAVHPQPESYCGNVNPIGPRACYDEGKRAAETAFFEYHRCHGVDIRVIRIFNTYGPQMCMDDGRVISNFITQALRNEDITIYGDGTQTRSFCYISDMIEGMYRVMNNEDPQAVGPFNIGNPEERTILQLADMIIRLCGSSSQIVHCELMQDDPTRRRPDIRLIGETTGWAPQVPIQEGLENTIAYFKREITRE